MRVSPLRGRVEIEPDAHALAEHVADWFARFAAAQSGRLRIALSGGSTPKELYGLLGGERFRAQITWPRIELYWGDERFVPRDDQASNYRMVREALLTRAPIPVDNVHPIPTDGAPGDAALRYEAVLARAYGSDALDPARPLFDLVLLGLGSDGHTCSLLPGQPVLDERRRWVAAVTAGREEPRITLTYPAIESSRTIAFLVAGGDKTKAVKAVRGGDERLPAARIRPQGDVIWFLDRAAAGSTTKHRG